jgi:hypothetical protein
MGVPVLRHADPCHLGFALSGLLHEQLWATGRPDGGTFQVGLSLVRTGRSLVDTHTLGCPNILHWGPHRCPSYSATLGRNAFLALHASARILQARVQAFGWE